MIKVCALASCERRFTSSRWNQVYCSARCKETGRRNRMRLVRLSEEEHTRVRRQRARSAAKMRRGNHGRTSLELETFRQAALWLGRRLAGDRTTDVDLRIENRNSKIEIRQMAEVCA